MNFRQDDTFVAGTFDGPLPFLLHLVQTAEISPSDLPLMSLLEQYLAKRDSEEPELDQGAEFIRATAFLIWLKSRALLPKGPAEEEPEIDIPLSFFQHLLDYCHFKEVAKGLLQREQKQQTQYLRATETLAPPGQTLGIDHISFNELQQIFTHLMEKAQPKSLQIAEEPWRVKDQIQMIRSFLAEGAQPLLNLFGNHLDRLGVIVTFLALLELLKREEVKLLSQENTLMVVAQ